MNERQPGRRKPMLFVNRRSFVRKTSLVQVLICAAIGFGAAGCNENEPRATNPTDEPLVEVPEIPGAVAAADFCGLADQIYCAGAVGCCSGADVVYGSVELVHRRQFQCRSLGQCLLVGTARQRRSRQLHETPGGFLRRQFYLVYRLIESTGDDSGWGDTSPRPRPSTSRYEPLDSLALIVLSSVP